MSILKSVLLGTEGSYNVLGTRVNFGKKPSTHYDFGGMGFISQLAIKCLNSNIFRWISQAYAHVFVHEMSHVLAIKSLTNLSVEVDCYTDVCEGRFWTPRKLPNDWRATPVFAAGPMGNVAFATFKLIAAKAFKNYLSWPIALAFGGGAATWILGELLYAYVSAKNKDDGDFGVIARKGKVHLALASTTLIAQCALAMLAVVITPPLK